MISKKNLCQSIAIAAVLGMEAGRRRFLEAVNARRDEEHRLAYELTYADLQQTDQLVLEYIVAVTKQFEQREVTVPVDVYDDWMQPYTIALDGDNDAAWDMRHVMEMMQQNIIDQLPPVDDDILTFLSRTFETGDIPEEPAMFFVIDATVQGFLLGMKAVRLNEPVVIPDTPPQSSQLVDVTLLPLTVLLFSTNSNNTTFELSDKQIETAMIILEEVISDARQKTAG